MNPHHILFYSLINEKKSKTLQLIERVSKEWVLYYLIIQYRGVSSEIIYTQAMKLDSISFMYSMYIFYVHIYICIISTFEKKNV